MTRLLPPGTILQHLFFRERLRSLPPGHFVEVGIGSGWLSKLLLDAGWTGQGFDLNPVALQQATQLNQQAILNGQYQIQNADWLDSPSSRKSDLILSSMVLEHLNEAAELRYFQKCQQELNPGGLLVLFVPGAPHHWGIEDEIAGHYRRYSLAELQEKTARYRTWQIRCLAGLTYPLSNVLLPLSNFLVRRAEAQKQALTMREKTIHSGARQVWLKTTFPLLFWPILNPVVLYPFHILQKLNHANKNSLILYLEATLCSAEVD